MTGWVQDCPPHLFISGNTGAGKTVLAKQIHAEIDRVSIFIDPMKAVNIGSVVESVDSVKRKLADGETTITFRPHWDDSEASNQVEELVGFLFELADRTPNVSYCVITDEVHNYAPQGADGSPIVRLHKEGRQFDIKAISVTQEPATAHDSLKKQSWHVWLGTPAEFARPYLRAFHVPIEELEKNREHEAVVLNEQMQVQYRVVAKSKYA